MFRYFYSPNDNHEQGGTGITIGEINWVRYARVWFDHVL
jgi:hypothetical protein